MTKKINLNKKNNNFYNLINELFLKIEDNLNLYLDKFDIDYEIQDYVITITFPNKSIIIVNKQEFLQQVWLATKINAYHFSYKNNEWICNRSSENFWKIFQNSCSIQLEKNLIFYNA